MTGGLWVAGHFVFAGIVKARRPKIYISCYIVGAAADVVRCTTRGYTLAVITSFRHKGKTVGIQVAHANRLRMLLAALDTAQTIQDMGLPGFKLHPLKGKLKGRWAVSVSGN